MSKPAALQAGMYYHIYNRGNNRETIFFEERNYRHFLHVFARHVEPVADTYAYCLLRNHFHLLVRIKTVEEIEQTLGVGNQTPRVGSVSQAFSNCFNAYAKAINQAYGRTGSLFQNPFGRIQVSSDAYLAQLVVYIHRNPQKHGLVEDFRDWPYSSYHALLSTEATRLRREDVLAWFDGAQGVQSAHGRELDTRGIVPLLVEDLD